MFNNRKVYKATTTTTYMPKEVEIFNFIKKEGEVVFSKICGELGINNYYAKRYLRILEEKKLIISIKRDGFTYFKIKK